MLSGITAQPDAADATTYTPVAINVLVNDVNAAGAAIVGFSSAFQGTVDFARETPPDLQSEYDYAGGDYAYGSIDAYVSSSYGGW